MHIKPTINACRSAARFIRNLLSKIFTRKPSEELQEAMTTCAASKASTKL